MAYRDAIFSLPPDLVATLNALALERDEPVNDLVRGMLDREVMRLRSARAAQLAKGLRLERLQRLLAPEIVRATGWADLRARLALYGVEFRAARGGLMLHDHITGEPLCPSTALGFGHGDFVRRFGGGMPEAIVAPELSTMKKTAGAVRPDGLNDLAVSA